MRALDCRAEASQLTAKILGRFHDDPFDGVAWMNRATATDYASFTPLVMRRAEGNPVGRRIVQAIAQASAEQIDGLVWALIALQC